MIFSERGFPALAAPELRRIEIPREGLVAYALNCPSYAAESTKRRNHRQQEQI